MALYNIGGMRKDYAGDVFTEEDLVAREPIAQFTKWFEEACKEKSILEANATCLSTATKDGTPSSRIVLLKGFGKEGFTFYTKYTSRKGQELEENPKASLCFYWEPCRRSVRIEGMVKRVPSEASDTYFASRPRGSQIAAVVSCRSSKLILNRGEINENVQKVNEEFKDKPIQRPNDWGGYLITPHLVEFWQGQSDRTHDRIVFRKKLEDEQIDPNLTKEGEDGWLIERLAP